MSASPRKYARRISFRDLREQLVSLATSRIRNADPGNAISRVLESVWTKVYAPKVATALDMLRTPIPADIEAARAAILRRRDGWLTMMMLQEASGPRLWTYEQWDDAADNWYHAVNRVMDDHRFAAFYLDKGALSVFEPDVKPGRYESWLDLNQKFSDVLTGTGRWWLNGFYDRVVDLPGAGLCGVSVRVEKGKKDYLVLQCSPLVTRGARFNVATPEAHFPYMWKLLPRWDPQSWEWKDIKTVVGDAPFEYSFPVSDPDWSSALSRADSRGRWWPSALTEALRSAGYAKQDYKKPPKGPRVMSEYGGIYRTP